MQTHTITINLPQGGGTEYAIPAKPIEQFHHPRLAERINQLNQHKTLATDANQAWIKAGNPRTGKTHATWQNAHEQLHHQLVETIDFAAATAGTARQHAIEQYRLNASRYERARQQMLAALHECAAHSNMAATVQDNPAALGVNIRTRDPLYLHVQFLTSQVEQLALRPIAD